jgi:SMC interacting uncharacterized protein involved in chromosome segregation
VLEQQFKDYVELYEKIGILHAKVDQAHQESEARAAALASELEQAKDEIRALCEKLKLTEAQLKAASGERDTLTKELEEAQVQLEQLEESARREALTSDGQVAEILQEQVVVSTALIQSLTQLQTVEAALSKERSESAALRREHKLIRRRLIAAAIGALITGLLFGWVLA